MIDYKNKIRDCTECSDIKKFSEFYWDKRRGIPRAICKQCTSVKAAKRYDPKVCRSKYFKRKQKLLDE